MALRLVFVLLVLSLSRESAPPFACAQQLTADDALALVRRHISMGTSSSPECTDVLDALLLAMPRDSEVLFLVGVVHSMAQRPAQAIEAYQQTLAVDPALQGAWGNMGLAFRATGLPGRWLRGRGASRERASRHARHRGAGLAAGAACPRACLARPCRLRPPPAAQGGV